MSNTDIGIKINKYINGAGYSSEIVPQLYVCVYTYTPQLIFKEDAKAIWWRMNNLLNEWP